VPHTIDRVTIHHTATAQLRGAKARKAIRRFQQFHQHHPRQPLPDIAYHYLIDAKGIVYAGRDPQMRGDTHTDYDPAGHLLIALLGNFERNQPTVQQRKALARLLAWSLAAYRLAPSAIALHSDHAQTACPGKHLAAWVASGQLIADVEVMQKWGGVALVPKCKGRGSFQSTPDGP